MLSKNLFLSLTALTIILSGCAHNLMRGSVAMKVSDTEAHVCLDDSEAKVGDRVTLYKNSCPNKAGYIRSGGVGGTCEKVKVGQGTVTEIINQHYSVVKFDSGVPFEEGMFIEKL